MPVSPESGVVVGLATGDDRPPETASPSLQAKRRFLCSASAYPGIRQQPSCVQTHMSWLFFVGEQVLKLKKPVRFPFLDFSTLQAREFYCREELRLNSRLAPGVYLGLLALQSGAAGLTLLPEDRLPAAGRTVDWLVWMRRLPRQRNLQHLIRKGHARADDVEAVAGVLAAFYQRAQRVSVGAAEYLGRFEREQAANREVLLRPQFQLRDADRILDRFDALLTRRAPLLNERAAGGHLRDGHGDLRPEHVYLIAPPVVIDCLEFNAELRQVDPVDELSFLGLECALAGAAWVGPHLTATCAEALGQPLPPAPLIALYTARRALLRSRLSMAHLLDQRPRTPRKWPVLAQAYLDAAAAALDAADAKAAVTAATSRGTP